MQTTLRKTYRTILKYDIQYLTLNSSLKTTVSLQAVNEINSFDVKTVELKVKKPSIVLVLHIPILKSIIAHK